MAPTKTLALFNSLAELHETLPLDQISISQLTTHAQVSRMYFYRNFTTYQDIIDSRIQELLDQFLRITKKRSTRSIAATTALFFENLQADAPALSVFLNNGEGDHVQAVFERGLTELINQGIVNGSTDPYWRAFIAGGFSRIITVWLRSDSPLTPAEMGLKVAQIVVP